MAIKAAYAFYDSINFKFSIRCAVKTFAAVFQNYFRHFFSPRAATSILYSMCVPVCACVCKRYTHLRVTWRLLLINAAPPSLEGCSQTVSAECLKWSAMGFSLFFFFPVLFENLMAQLGRVDYTGQQRKCYEQRGCGLRVSFEILA